MIPHTPAPWKVLREGRHLYVVDEQEVTVATVTLQPLEPEWQAGNATLMAAAPIMCNMLKALRDAVINTPVLDDSDDWTELLNQADAVLAQVGVEDS